MKNKAQICDMSAFDLITYINLPNTTIDALLRVPAGTTANYKSGGARLSDSRRPLYVALAEHMQQWRDNFSDVATRDRTTTGRSA